MTHPTNSTPASTPESTPPDRPYLPAMNQRRLLPVYDAFTRLLGARRVQRRLVAQAGIGREDTVLEIGAGTGTVLLMAKQAVPTATVIGTDPDPEALGAATRRAVSAGVQLRLDHGYADRLPYDDGSVDRVLSSFMFHHVPTDQKLPALLEARRVLAPGGSLHLADIGGEPAGPIGRLMHLVGGHDHGDGHGHGHGGHGHGHGGQGDHGATRPALTGPAELLELLGAAGFAGAAVVGSVRTLVGPAILYRAERG